MSRVTFNSLSAGPLMEFGEKQHAIRLLLLELAEERAGEGV